METRKEEHLVEGPSTCFICQKVRGQITIPGGLIWRDELIQATHLFPGPDGSAYLGYLLIEPLPHAPGWPILPLRKLWQLACS
jgi:hypothetical protein